MKEQKRKVPYLMLGLMMIGTLIAILNNVAINIALPEIMRDLEIENYSTIQWLSTANMLVAGVLIPTSAFFITKFKSNHVFLTAMGVFTLGTLLAIVSPNFALLLIARVVQASGIAILMPLLMNVMLACFSREDRGKAMGIYGLIYMLAPVIGPLFAGLVVDNFGWRTIFIIIAPLSLLILAISWWKLENVLEQRPATIDTTSFMLSAIGFASLLFGFSNASVNGWTHVSVYGMIMVGAVALALFAKRQFKIPNPLLDLRVYTFPMFALSSVISVILALILYAPIILLPFYFQNILGYSTLQSALFIIPGYLFMAICMPIAGKLYDKIGALPLALIGFPLIGVASYALSILRLDTSAAYVAFWFIVRCIGVGLVMVPVQTNGLNQLPSRLNASGSAINNTLQQASGAVGTAIFITLKSNYATSRATELINDASRLYGAPISAAVEEELMTRAGIYAINHTSFVTIGFVAIALLFSLFIKKRVHQDNPIDVEVQTTHSNKPIIKGLHPND